MILISCKYTIISQAQEKDDETADEVQNNNLIIDKEIDINVSASVEVNKKFQLEKLNTNWELQQNMLKD